MYCSMTRKSLNYFFATHFIGGEAASFFAADAGFPAPFAFFVFFASDASHFAHSSAVYSSVFLPVANHCFHSCPFSGGCFGSSVFSFVCFFADFFFGAATF